MNYSNKLSDVIAKVRGSFDESVLKSREEKRNEGVKNKELKRKRKLI